MQNLNIKLNISIIKDIKSPFIKYSTIKKARLINMKSSIN